MSPNFQTAFNPQIVKSYVSRDYDYLQSLMIRASKLSSYLIIIFLVPLMFEAGNVLTIWLGNYPHYAVEFAICTLLAIFVEAISAPLWMMIYAQTDIKRYQIVISIVYSLNFWGGWLALFLGAVPYCVIMIRIMVFVALAIIRLLYVKKFFGAFDVKKWVVQVVGKSMLIIIVASALTGLFASAFKASLFLHVAVTTIVSLCLTIPMIYFIGLDLGERNFIRRQLAGRLRHFIR